MLNGAKKVGSMCQQHLKSVSKKIKYEKILKKKVKDNPKFEKS